MAAISISPSFSLSSFAFVQVSSSSNSTFVFAWILLLNYARAWLLRRLIGFHNFGHKILVLAKKRASRFRRGDFRLNVAIGVIGLTDLLDRRSGGDR